MDPNNLAGPIKVAILIQAMSESTRNKVLNSFNKSQRERIAGNLSEMGVISQNLVEKVAQEFLTAIDHRKNNNKEMVSGEDKSNKKKEGKPLDSTKLEALLSFEPEHLVQLIREEQPQTIAIILLHLKPEVASEVLSKLPDEIKADVAYRIASSEKLVSGMIEEIEMVFQEILANEKGSSVQKIGGIATVAEILNQIDGSSSQLILDELDDLNPEMAAEIKQRMFVFEDLVMVDDKGLQGLLRRVETKELATALKAASEDVKEKIFKNMSERAADMVNEEIEGLGAVRMKDVDNAQQTITKIIQEMEEKGEIIISGRRGEQFIA